MLRYTVARTENKPFEACFQHTIQAQIDEGCWKNWLHSVELIQTRGKKSKFIYESRNTHLSYNSPTFKSTT